MATKRKPALKATSPNGDVPEMTPIKAPAPQQKTVTHEYVISDHINKVRNEVKYVKKTGRVKYKGTDYTYATEADTLAALRPALIKHGLVFCPSYESHTVAANGDVTLVQKIMLTHAETGAVWPYELKAVGSCKNNLYGSMTGGMRHFYLKFFQLETGDDPEREEQRQGEAAEKTPVATASKPASSQQSVQGYVFNMLPGATDQARGNRRKLFDSLATRCGLVANTPYDKVTEAQWQAVLTLINEENS